MKASIKFREDQTPLTRAKIPLSILGFPFQSGVVSGSQKELALSLATAFESGPSIKISYRPNDGFNPFNLVFKTGIGRFGSPNPSPMTMSAEFNLVGSHNQRFFIHFKPQIGDFFIKKSQSSDFVKKGSNGGLGSGSDDDSIEMVDPTVVMPETQTQAVARMLCGLLRGMEGSANTSLPVMRRAVVNFRWGFRLPAEDNQVKTSYSIRKLPLLVINKISIEHMAEDESGSDKVDIRAKLGCGEDDVAGVKRQLEMIQCENGMLRKGLDELRYEVASGKFVFPVAAGGEKKLKEERDGKEDLKKGI